MITLGDRRVFRVLGGDPSYFLAPLVGVGGAAWEAVRAGAPTHPDPAVSRRPPGNVLTPHPRRTRQE